MSEKKTVPLRNGLWTTPTGANEAPQLIGSRCPKCGEIFFPKKEKGICINCQHKGLEEIKLSRRGKIYSFAVVMQKPPIYYKGTVPYALAWIELPEGVRFESLLTDGNFDNIKVGTPVELVIEKLHEDEEGNDVLTYKFRPIDSK